MYPNAPPHPPSYEDLYGPEPSAPPKQDIGYAYGNESFSGRESSHYPVHYREPPSQTKHSKSHITHSGNIEMDYKPHYRESPAEKGIYYNKKINVLGGKRRRRRHKLY